MGIKKWPKNDRPREKLFKYGEHTLTNAELLAILFRSGKSAPSAARCTAMSRTGGVKLKELGEAVDGMGV